MRSKHVMIWAAVVFAAALSHGALGCSATSESAASTREPIVVTRLGTGRGGDLRKPTWPCSGDESFVYHYIAKTFGVRARIEEYCVANEEDDIAIHQPEEGFLGPCPVKQCGEARTARRGPLEHAVLQAIVNLEYRRKAVVGGGERTFESGMDSHHTEVLKGKTKFVLDEGVECSAGLMLYSERSDRNSALDDALSAKNIQRFYGGGEQVSSGTIWVEHKPIGTGYRLLVVQESQFEGGGDAEMFKQTISCASTQGPVSLRDSPHYGFRVQPEPGNRDEWVVRAFRKKAP